MTIVRMIFYLYVQICLWKGAFVNPHCLFFLALLSLEEFRQYNVEHRGYALRKLYNNYFNSKNSLSDYLVLDSV